MVVAHPPAVAVPGTAPLAVHSAANPAPHGWVTHVVRRGDTVAGLAVSHSTSTSVLVARNHLASGGRSIAVGQRLWVPQTAAAAARAKAQARAAAKARAAARARAAAAARAAAKARYAATHYRVRRGDTLSAIAIHRKMTLGALLRANKLSARSLLHPGQVLVVKAAPGSIRPAAPAAKARTATRAITRVTVHAGDTLSALAVGHHSSVAAIIKSNRLPSTVIRVGQVLAVPVPAATPKTPANTFAGRTYSDAVVRAAAANRAAIAAHRQPTRAQVKAMVAATARRHGVDPKLAMAISYQESGWDQRQVSVANAIGVMQVIPDSGRWASQLVGRSLDLRRTQDNITAGVVILRALDRMAGNHDQAIAGYYQGLGSVRAHGMYADTKQYVASVKALKKRM